MIIHKRPDRAAAIATTHSVVVTVGKASLRSWVVAIKKVDLPVMVDTETVHLIPRPHIRGQDTGMNGGTNNVELDKPREM